MMMIERTAVSVARWKFCACLALVLAAPGMVSAQSRYSGIVVFGTSLSDPGNAFTLVGDHGTPPDFNLNPLLIPNAPYARGGHHFSNGATWIEQFARSIGLEASVRPALATASAQATNYAVGAARATACVTPNDAPFTCKDADAYLFWDGIHPTKAGHAILARELTYVLP